MSAFFNRWFGNQVPSQVCYLDSPGDLKFRDGVAFASLEQTGLSHGRFQVSDVKTYQFERGFVPTLQLIGEDGMAFQMVVETGSDGQEEGLKVSRKISRRQVVQLFDMEVFSQLFEEKFAPFLLPRILEPIPLTGWTAPIYKLWVDAEPASFHAGEYLESQRAENDQGEVRAFDYYLLVGEKGDKMIELEVYDDGELDIFVSITLPVTCITSMWEG